MIATKIRVTAEAWTRVSRSGHWTFFSSAQQEARKPVTGPRRFSGFSACVPSGALVARLAALLLLALLARAALLAALLRGASAASGRRRRRRATGPGPRGLRARLGLGPARG